MEALTVQHANLLTCLEDVSSRSRLTEKVYRALECLGKAKVKDIAQALAVLEGKDLLKMQREVSAILNQLAKEGKARKVERGVYEIVKQQLTPPQLEEEKEEPGIVLARTKLNKVIVKVDDELWQRYGEKVRAIVHMIDAKMREEVGSSLQHGDTLALLDGNIVVVIRNGQVVYPPFV